MKWLFLIAALLMPGMAFAGNNVSIDGRIYAQAYGAKADLIYSGDGTHLQDGVCNGTTTFTSASGGFTRALVGDTVLIDNGGGYSGTVVAVPFSTAITLSSTCASGTALNWRIGFDNSAAFNAAVAAAAYVSNIGPSNAGTVHISAGRYLTLSAVTVPRADCNVTIEGDPSGTILMPYFNNSYGYGWSDQTLQFPLQCYGGMRNVTFQNVGNAPQNLNLIYVSNEQGIAIDHIRCNLYDSPGDSCILIDPGIGTNPTALQTWTETTRMTYINNWFTTNMLTFDGKNDTGFSVNNNSLTNSHCDPTGSFGGFAAGACIKLTRWGGGGALLSSYFNFDADLNGTGLSLISNDSRADQWNPLNATIDIRSQALTSGTSCFKAPANTGWWGITGQAICTGSALEANNNPVIFNARSTSDASNNFYYNSPVALSNCGTSPTLGAGSSAAAGEIIAGSGATACALTFAQFLGPHNIDCHATADGQPTFLFNEGNKGENVVTFTCVNTAASDANCMSGAFFSYGCTGF